jgi:hypothetical protein
MAAAGMLTLGCYDLRDAGAALSLGDSRIHQDQQHVANPQPEITRTP